MEFLRKLSAQVLGVIYAIITTIAALLLKNPPDIVDEGETESIMPVPSKFGIQSDDTMIAQRLHPRVDVGLAGFFSDPRSYLLWAMMLCTTSVYTPSGIFMASVETSFRLEYWS